MHFRCEIIAIDKSQFLNDPMEYMALANHLVLSGSMDLIQAMLEFACSYNVKDQQCSLAFLPLADQKELRSAYQLSNSLNENIDTEIIVKFIIL